MNVPQPPPATVVGPTATDEIEQGKRFEFGANWSRFVCELDDERIAIARDSLRRMLETDTLLGTTFLDVGSGSGLFSLAARQLGAEVHSFDYDPQSTATTAQLKQRFAPEDPHWRIEQGSVLDRDYLARLGRFDVVYSWGVLHHTGALWQACANAAELVNSGGKLFIAVYNFQRIGTARWQAIKRRYNRSGRFIRLCLVLMVGAYFFFRGIGRSLLQGRPPRPVSSWRKNAKKRRGMSAWHDLVDWVGGYPFEAAKPEEVFNFFRQRGFVLEQLTTQGGELGCNEYVFKKSSA